MFTTRSPCPPAPATDPPAGAKPALWLVAHGSSRCAPANAILVELGAALRKLGRFGPVRVGALRGEPNVERLRRAVGQERPVVVAPLFLSDGYPLRVAFPGSLGLTGPELAQTVHLLPPLFAWPEAIELLSAEIRRTAMSAGWQFCDCTVVLAAHGSSKGPGSARATAAVAAALARSGIAARTGYLSEAPFLPETLKEITGPVVLVNLFVLPGEHACVDVPELAAAYSGGPITVTPPLAGNPAFAAMIAAVADRCLSARPRSRISPDPALPTSFPPSRGPLRRSSPFPATTER